MGKKNKKPLVEWQQEQKQTEEEKTFKREDVIKALIKIRAKRPRIKSSHG